MWRLWQHSLIIAHLAKSIAIAEHQPLDICNTAFTAGLMHDCGKLVIAHYLPERYGALLSTSYRSLNAFEAAEHGMLGLSHADVGGYLLALWGLPDSMVEAVVFHHHPSDCPAVGFTPLTAVHIAEGFERCGLAPLPSTLEAEVDRPYLDRLGLAQRIPIWADLAIDFCAKAQQP